MMQTQKIERLETRLTTIQKELIQRAADLVGRSLSDFVINASQKAARKLIREHNIIKLSAEDSKRFVEALLNPPEPSAALKAAAKRYHDMIKSKQLQVE